ncbi:MAG: SPOR domain-containing protein [Gammaproteobacteria bacterium]|nr:SPOR domain-containing protein [Gammaproteobacteria bacterium]
MSTKDREDLHAFAQKMHDEGAAGFASGLTPWETWDDFEDRAGSRVWRGTAEHVSDKERSKSSFGDRVLTAMAVLAVATLAIGIAGVYITQEPALQVADSNAQLQSTAPAMKPEIRLPWQGTAVDAGKEDIALNNDVSFQATETPVSPIAHGNMTIGTTEEPSEAHSTGKGSDTAVTEPDPDSQLALAALDDLPAPAAGVPAGAARVPSTNNTPPGQAVAAAGDKQPSIPETTTAKPGNSAPVQPARPSQASKLAAHTEPLQPPEQAITHSEPAGKPGDWSINLVSYLKKSTAEKMRSRFLDKGVAADQVMATVNGKTYYRLRVTGFETREAAIKQSTTIKEQLGLKETWITKK